MEYELNEIRQLNLWHCINMWDCLSEIRLCNVVTLLNKWNWEWEFKTRGDMNWNWYTTEFVTILNKCDCWKRWECKTRSDNWICYIVKFVELWMRYECKICEFANCRINGTVEKDDNVNEIRLLNL